jgi:hypothetical protein
MNRLLQPSDHQPPEDFTGWVTANIDEREWELSCGKPGCGAVLADASWFDMQLAMLLNGGDEFASRAAIASLPPVSYRPYRMHVLFTPMWRKRADDDVWIASTVTEAQTTDKPGKPKAFNRRVVRGSLRAIELGQEAVPPVKVICPACNTLQVIERRRRKGAPGYSGDKPAEPADPDVKLAPGDRLRRAMGGR